MDFLELNFDEYALSLDFSLDAEYPGCIDEDIEPDYVDVSEGYKLWELEYEEAWLIANS